MSQRQPYISIDSVINDYLNESEQSIIKYAKLWHIAFRGLEQMGLDFFYKIKSVKLPVNANFTVNIPADYLNWTKVGILNNDGAIILLMENNNMATYADLLPNRIEKTDDPQSSVLQWQYGNNIWNNYWNGTGYTNVYGVPAGQPFVGEFKVDIENGVIILNKDFRRDYIMLEYVSSPMEGGEYYLPVQFREALIAWITWKDGNAKSIKSNMMLGDKRDKRDEFYNERRQAIARWKPIRLQEQMQTSLEMSRLAVKV